MGFLDSIFAGGGIGGFNPFGIFGETNADVKAKDAQGNATNLAGNAAGQYNTLGGWGTQDYQQGQNLLGQYLSQYLQSAGVLPPAQQGLNPYQNIGGGTDAAGLRPNAYGQDVAGGRTPNGANAPALNGQPTQGQPNPGLYDLTPAQQQQLNLQVGDINQRRQSALSELQAEFANRGISDPRAMAAAQTHIHSLFDNMATGAQSQFAENARQQREGALQNVLQIAQNFGNKGSQEVGQAGSGLGTLAGAAQNNAQYQQGQANALGNQGWQLLGAGLGGVFGGTPNLGGSPSITPIGGSGGTFGSGGLGGGGTLNGGYWNGGFGGSNLPILY